MNEQGHKGPPVVNNIQNVGGFFQIEGNCLILWCIDLQRPLIKTLSKYDYKGALPGENVTHTLTTSSVRFVFDTSSTFLCVSVTLGT